MNKAIKILAVALIVQLSLWAFLQFSGTTSAQNAQTLLDAQLLEADELAFEIADAEGKLVSLQRAAEGWRLLSGLPADSAKASALLEKLSLLSLDWPASTSADAHERFEVAEEKFQRRFKLTADGNEETLFFGTSPGYQQVHARSEGDSVFAVKIANYELPASDDDWLDKALLTSNGEITSVTWAENVVITKEASDWLLNGEVANIEATREAVGNLADLRVLGVLESAPTAAPADAREILVSDTDGEYRLSFWSRESNNDHVIVSTRYPGEAFRMANYVAEQLVPEEGALEAPQVPKVDLDPEALGL